MSTSPIPGLQSSRRRFFDMATEVPLATATADLTIGAGAAHATDSAYVMGCFTESPSGLGTDLGYNSQNIHVWDSTGCAPSWATGG